MKSRVRAAALLAAVAVGLTACAGAGGEEQGGGALAISMNTDPATFDPALARGGDDLTFARLLFDTLLRNDDGSALAGGIAESWETIDAAHYTITIRDDATCADGTPISATVVADSLARLADPETASTARSLIFGAATATFTPDDEAATVSVELSEGWADFLVGLTAPQAGIVCPAGMADLDGLATGSVEGAFSGPYSLTSSTPAVGYDLALREDYDAWPAFQTPLSGTPAATITLRPITDYTTIATQLFAGDLDAGVVADENVTRFEGDEDFSIFDNVNTTAYLIFNERAGATFADRPDLREAVAQVVEAAAFSDIATDGRGEPILSVVGPSVQCVNTDTELITAHDPDAAADVLSGVKVRIVGTTLLSAGNDYIGDVLRNAGADVTVESLDNATWSTVTSGGGTEWDINVQGDQNLLGTLTPSLLRIMGPASEDGGRNKGGTVNDAGYAALGDAMRADTSDAYCESMQAAQASFLERVDAVPLTTIPTSNVVRDGVEMRVFDDILDIGTLRFSE